VQSNKGLGFIVRCVHKLLCFGIDLFLGTLLNQRRISEHSRNEHRLCNHQLIHRSAESSHKDVSLSTAEMSTDCAHISRSTTTTCLGFFFEHGFSCSSKQSVNMLISFWSIISSGFEFWKFPPDYCRCMTSGQSLERNLVKAFDIESTGTSSPPSFCKPLTFQDETMQRASQMPHDESGFLFEAPKLRGSESTCISLVLQMQINFFFPGNVD
jgi:hypothetical protein